MNLVHRRRQRYRDATTYSHPMQRHHMQISLLQKEALYLTCFLYVLLLMELLLFTILHSGNSSPYDIFLYFWGGSTLFGVKWFCLLIAEFLILRWLWEVYVPLYHEGPHALTYWTHLWRPNGGDKDGDNLVLSWRNETKWGNNGKRRSQYHVWDMTSWYIRLISSINEVILNVWFIT